MAYVRCGCLSVYLWELASVWVYVSRGPLLLCHALTVATFSFLVHVAMPNALPKVSGHHDPASSKQDLPEGAQDPQVRRPGGAVRPARKRERSTRNPGPQPTPLGALGESSTWRHFFKVAPGGLKPASTNEVLSAGTQNDEAAFMSKFKVTPFGTDRSAEDAACYKKSSRKKGCCTPEEHNIRYTYAKVPADAVKQSDQVSQRPF